MELLIVLLAVAILGAAAVASAGGLGQMRSQPVRDVYQPLLPERRLRPEDLDRLRFGMTARGYHTGQVDAFVARVRDELSRAMPALHVEDLDLLRFDMTVRGYQMAQVDEFVERIQRELSPVPDEPVAIDTAPEAAVDPESVT